MCERIALPDGGMAIVCGGRHRNRVICDVCDRPVPKGSPQFTFQNKKIDLCPSCRDNRERGDPEWRRFAEKAIAHNLGLVLEPALT